MSELGFVGALNGGSSALDSLVTATRKPVAQIKLLSFLVHE